MFWIPIPNYLQQSENYLTFLGTSKLIRFEGNGSRCLKSIFFFCTNEIYSGGCYPVGEVVFVLYSSRIKSGIACFEVLRAV
jgi:hypothetical protein